MSRIEFAELSNNGAELQLDQLKQVTNADGAFPALTSTKGKVELAYLYKLQSASIIKMFPKLEQSGLLAAPTPTPIPLPTRFAICQVNVARTG